MQRFLLSLVGLVIAGQACADTLSLGRYQLRTPEDAARVARLSGKSVPEGGLTLHANGRFLLESGGNVRHGDYRFKDDLLTLRVEDGSELRGEVRDGLITLEGLKFDRVRSQRDESTPRRFPTDGASGRRNRDDRNTRDEVARTELPRTELPVEAAAPKPLPVLIPATPDLETVFKEPYKEPAPKAPVLRRLEAKEIAGAWTVWRNGREEKGQKMTLKSDGTFRFTMVNASSEGTWTVEDRHIVLVWTKIDGESIEEPGSMRKEIPVSDDGGAFQIDTYHYERATP